MLLYSCCMVPQRGASETAENINLTLACTLSVHLACTQPLPYYYYYPMAENMFSAEYVSTSCNDSCSHASLTQRH